MNDFAELEDQLKKLRPAKVSDELFALVEEELVDVADEDDSSGKIVRPDRFRFNWLAIGAGMMSASRFMA